MEHRLPLSALLSQVLVAFTIEFDNEFEHQTPHRTTNHGATPGSGPWLVSMAMWSMLMRYVPDDDIAVQELKKLSGLDNRTLQLWLVRLSKWWGYLAIESRTAVRPTPGGRKALHAWRPLAEIIEKRWRKRFDAELIDQLCKTMDHLETRQPDYLPILGFDLLTRPTGHELETHTLPGLLAKTLLTLAVDFETESNLSLALCANVLRLAVADGVRVRDLPHLSGVSKEAIAMAVKRLEERDLVEIVPMKTLVLTPKGRLARQHGEQLLQTIEERRQSGVLRPILEQLLAHPRFSSGLEPYPDGWRAAVAKPATLPHYPMVLHRGGFPDGS